MVTNTRNAAYPHRRNFDGSFDSICTICFATVARSQDEAALEIDEKSHSCEEAILDGRGIFTPAVARHFDGTAA